VRGWKEKSELVKSMFELFGAEIPEWSLWLLAVFGLVVVIASALPWGRLLGRQPKTEEERDAEPTEKATVQVPLSIKLTVFVESRNGTPAEATFHIGRRKDGTLIFRQIS
jgi:hypothetical protein